MFITGTTSSRHWSLPWDRVITQTAHFISSRCLLISSFLSRRKWTKLSFHLRYQRWMLCDGLTSPLHNLFPANYFLLFQKGLYLLKYSGQKESLFKYLQTKFPLKTSFHWEGLQWNQGKDTLSSCAVAAFITFITFITQAAESNSLNTHAHFIRNYSIKFYHCQRKTDTRYSFLFPQT